MTFHPDEKTRVVEGPGALDRLGSLASELGGRRVLLVSDPGVARVGHMARAEASLVAAGLSVVCFTEVSENPTTEDVARGLAVAQQFDPELYVAVGGGSPIDAAKGVNFLHVCGGEMRDYWGHHKATRPLRPLIAVPTTAGTGSEVQSFALISDALTHRKMACGDPSAAPRIALLDAELTLSMPPFVTACTGLDTLGHALESAVTKARTPRSAEYARAAFRVGFSALQRVLEAPSDVDARAAMLRAAALAGLAIEHSMLGAAHALANPLTAQLGVPHGLAVGLMVPHVVRFNAQQAEARGVYEALARDVGLDCAEALADALEALVPRAGLPRDVAAVGVTEERIPGLAAEAATQWTAGFNPRSVTAEELGAILRAALVGRTAV